jgi:hypothetical protein
MFLFQLPNQAKQILPKSVSAFRNNIGWSPVKNHFPTKSWQRCTHHYRMGNMNTKSSVQLSEDQIDELVIAQADDMTAWEEPVDVLISQQAVSLPPELAKRAAFFAKLHNKSNAEEWLQGIIRERIQFEEAAFVDLKQAMISR